MTDEKTLGQQEVAPPLGWAIDFVNRQKRSSVVDHLAQCLAVWRADAWEKVNDCNDEPAAWKEIATKVLGHIRVTSQRVDTALATARYLKARLYAGDPSGRDLINGIDGIITALATIEVARG